MLDRYSRARHNGFGNKGWIKEKNCGSSRSVHLPRCLPVTSLRRSEVSTM